MKIKTRLRLGALVAIAMIVGVAAFVASTLAKNQRMLGAAESLDSISRAASHLNNLTHEYALVPSERIKSQWNLQDEELRTLLEHSGLDDPEAQEGLKRLSARASQLEETFARLVRHTEHPPEGLAPDAYRTTQRGLEADSLVRSQEIIAEASHIHDAVRKKADESLSSTGPAALFALAVIAVALGGTSLLTSRRLARQVADLQEGTVAIRQGDFGHRTNLNSDDELGDLSRAFDGMAEELELQIRSRATAEAGLKKSDERFKAIFESTTDCVLVWDRNYNYLFANQAAIDHVGTTRDRIIGKNIRDGLGHVPEFMKLWISRIDRVFETSEPMRVEDIVPFGDSEVYSESTISPIRDENGDVFAVGVVYRDVTTRRQEEKELEKHRNHLEELVKQRSGEIEKKNAMLRESEERLATTLSCIGDGVIVTDMESRITRINKAAMTLTGWSSGEAAGKPLSDVFVIINETTREPIDNPVSEVIATGRIQGLANHTVLIAKDGTEVAIADSASPIVDPEGVTMGVVLVFRDVSEDREKEREREELLHTLDERVKELNCLHRLDELLRRDELPIKRVLQETVELLPPAWQYPDSTCARIVLNDEVFETNDFIETEWVLAARILLHGKTVGGVSVFYKDKQDDSFEGPFLREERHLIDSVAYQLTRYVEGKEASRELEERESLYRALVDNLPQKIFVKDKGLRYLSVNKNYANDLGMEPSDFVGKTDWDFFPEDLARKYRQDDQKAVDGGKLTESDEEYLKDGETRIVHTIKTPFIDDLGNVGGVLGIFWDVTRERHLQEQITTDRERLLAMMDGIDDLIYVADPDTYELVHVNRAMLEIWGKGIIGEKCYRILQGREEPCTFCTNDKIFGENLGKAYSWEFRNEKTGRWYRCADKAIKWVDGRTVRFELASDITPLKETEAQLAETNRELERSNTELEQFAYVASHDLQEPLRKIESFTQLLAKKYKGSIDDKADHYINYIIDGTSRMRDLIHDLLTFSRVRSRARSLETTSSEDALKIALDNLEFSIKEAGAEITSESLPDLKADSTQLTQLFQNLIGNAAKFRGDRKPHIHIGAVEKDGFWEFTVKDNGIGIDREYSGKIFGVFQRLHSRGEYPGNGIGLAVCKRIVERHGGRIWVESVQGQGSCFHFTIQATASEPITEEDIPEIEGEHNGADDGANRSLVG